jgi:hypothetical protein
LAQDATRVPAGTMNQLKVSLQQTVNALAQQV